MYLWIPLLQQVLHYSEFQSTLILLAGALGSFSAVKVVQWGSKRWDLAVLCGIALLVESLVILGLGWNTSYSLSIMGYFLMLSANTTVSSTLIAARGTRAPAARQSIVGSSGTFFQVVGFTIGGFLSALIVLWLGIPGTFTLSAVSMALTAILLLWFFRCKDKLHIDESPLTN
jgi:predicted MFS family arabinose efflux permease